MLAAMARNRFTVRTLVPVLGIAVLILGGLSAWVFVRERAARSAETPFARAERQVREQRGPDWEVRYVEAGAEPATAAGKTDGSEAKPVGLTNADKAADKGPPGPKAKP